MRAPSVGQVWVLRVPRWAWLSPCIGCVRRFRPPPPSLSVFGPSSVCFFFSLALSGFASSGLGVLVLVFPLFLSSFAFPVSSPAGGVVCHLISISFIFTFISFVGALKSRSLKEKPLLLGVCVKHLNRCKTCTFMIFVAGGWRGHMRLHPTKLLI